MIKPEEFQTLAEIWIQGATEAEWRSAVSRAYYATFHKARQLLRILGFQIPRGDQTHAYLWLRFSNCGDAPIQLAGSDLRSLRRDRNWADYQVEQTLTKANGLLQVQTARRIIQVLQTGFTEPTRTQITDAMKIYERDVLEQITWTP